jgi:tetratricopeptide (TPR) repeat protein
MQGGFDPMALLDMEKRTGIGNDDVDRFIAKTTEVETLIKGMKDGTIDPDDKRIRRKLGIKTKEEKETEDAARIKREKEREIRRVIDEKREREAEHKKWWGHAELMYGEDEENMTQEERDHKAEERVNRIVNCYTSRDANDYSQWKDWEPKDPVTLAEKAEQEAMLSKMRDTEFEKTNAEFCNNFKNDMEERQKSTLKKREDSEREKKFGNAYFKRKDFKQAMGHYMTALDLDNFKVPLLTNIAQVHLKNENYDQVLEFCKRAIYVDKKCIKAYSRRAKVHIVKKDYAAAMKDLSKAVEIEPDNHDLRKEFDDLKETVAELKMEGEVNERVKALEAQEQAMAAKQKAKKAAASKKSEEGKENSPGGHNSPEKDGSNPALAGGGNALVESKENSIGEFGLGGGFESLLSNLTGGAADGGEYSSDPKVRMEQQMKQLAKLSPQELEREGENFMLIMGKKLIEQLKMEEREHSEKVAKFITGGTDETNRASDSDADGTDAIEAKAASGAKSITIVEDDSDDSDEEEETEDIVVAATSDGAEPPVPPARTTPVSCRSRRSGGPKSPGRRKKHGHHPHSPHHHANKGVRGTAPKVPKVSAPEALCTFLSTPELRVMMRTGDGLELLLKRLAWGGTDECTEYGLDSGEASKSLVDPALVHTLEAIRKTVEDDSRNKKLVCSKQGTKAGKIHGLQTVLKMLIEPPSPEQLPEGLRVRSLLLGAIKLVGECADLEQCVTRICNPKKPETLTAILALLMANDAELVTAAANLITSLTQNTAAKVALREAEPEPLSALGHAILAQGPELVLKAGASSASTRRGKTSPSKGGSKNPKKKGGKKGDKKLELADPRSEEQDHVGTPEQRRLSREACVGAITSLTLDATMRERMATSTAIDHHSVGFSSGGSGSGRGAGGDDGTEQVQLVRLLIGMLRPQAEGGHETSIAESSALAALMNGCLETTGKARQQVVEAGGLPLFLALVSPLTRSKHATDEAVVRAAGLISRCAQLPPAKEMLARPHAFTTLVRAMGGAERSKLSADCSAKLDEHLVRIIAVVIESPELQKLLLKEGGLKKLLAFLPPPNFEEAFSKDAATRIRKAREFALARGTCIGNATRCLIQCLTPDAVNGDVGACVVESEGVARFITLLRDSKDGPVRKNVAIALAKLTRNPKAMEQIKALRGMEMLRELGNSLLK